MRNHKKGRHLLKAILVAAMGLLGSSAYAQNTVPVFQQGSDQTDTICYGTASLASYLMVDDTDAGQTETWTVVTPPTHGTILETANTAASGTGVYPPDYSYHVNDGYSGLDTFSIMVDDGNGGMDTTTIIVVVRDEPRITLGTVPGVCFGSSATSLPYSGETGSPISYSILWDAPATTAGFENDTDVALIGSPIPLSVPPTATADVYGGNIRVKNVFGCESAPIPFTAEVFALPVLTTSVTPGQICNNNTFSYIQGGTDVATFMWSRAAVPHITNSAANGVGDINEVLLNDTAIQVEVTYVDTLVSSHSCMSIYNIVVTVNPTPTLYPTPLIGTLCDGGNFGFFASSQTPTTTFSWSREASTGNPAASGTGPNISEILNNPTTAPVTITYVDTLRAYGCMNTQTVQVIVNPTPHLTSTHTPHSICDSTLFRYLDSTQTAGVTSFAWSRGPVTGIANPAASGADSIKEYLDNTTDNPIAVTYVYTLMTNGGCTNNETVTVFVNPTARLSNSSLTLPSVCDSAAIHFLPATNTVGASIAWTRPFIAGISATAGSGGAGDINEHLHNTTANPITVTYVYTTTIDGCSHIDNVKVAVNPKPQISNLTTIATAVCDNTPFSFTPSSGTAGATYNWFRPYVSGIGAVEQTGTGNINETLKNNTNVNVPVTYIYTVTANGCSATQSFTFDVHPTPTLRAQTTPLITCSGASYSYKLESLTPNVSFTWTYVPVANLTATPSTGTGTGTATINTKFLNTSSAPLTANFAVNLSLGTSPTCSYIDTVKVTVEAIPTPTAISVKPNGKICAGAMYQNFGAAVAPSTGSTYTWSATNATVWATGTTGQYAIISFPQAGQSIVTLSAVNSNGCNAAISDTVTIDGGAIDQPTIIYTSSHFVCLQNDVKSFQWGYDDAATLDSTGISGAIDQSYFVESPDLVNKHYWVMIGTNDGCMKKAYFNAPTGVTDLNTSNEIKVFPNPAANTLNVEMNTTVQGAIRIEVANMLGQKLNVIETNEHKTAINVADLAAGYYIVDCFIGDLKIGTAKFIKN